MRIAVWSKVCELYPDFNIDVEEEQRLLVEHDVIVFHHPFYWYSSPALLKEWQDLVKDTDLIHSEEHECSHRAR